MTTLEICGFSRPDGSRLIAWSSRLASSIPGGGALALVYLSVSSMPDCFLVPGQHECFLWLCFTRLCLSPLFRSANCNEPADGINNVPACSNSYFFHPAPLPI